MDKEEGDQREAKKELHAVFTHLATAQAGAHERAGGRAGGRSCKAERSRHGLIEIV